MGIASRPAATSAPSLSASECSSGRLGLATALKTVAADRYLFDHRNANVSVNGQTFVEWFVDEYYGGPAGIGNKNIIGFCRSNGNTR